MWRWHSRAPVLQTGKLAVYPHHRCYRSDEIVPSGQIEDLYQKSKESSRLPRFHSVKGGTHNETWLQGGQEYWLAIKKFMQEASNKYVK